MPNHKRAIQLYQETQRLSLPGSLTRTPHDYAYEVVEAASLRRRDAEIHVSPQVIFIREPHRPEMALRKEVGGASDFMTQVFCAAFLGSAAFFVLYALITLMAGVRP